MSMYVHDRALNMSMYVRGAHSYRPALSQMMSSIEPSLRKPTSIEHWRSTRTPKKRRLQER